LIINNHVFFTSRIELKSQAKFDEETKNVSEAGFDWSYRTKRTAKELRALHAGVCCVGGVQNGEEVSMFHLISDSRHYNGNSITPAVTNMFDEIIQELNKEEKNNKKLNGLIAGADDFSPWSPPFFNSLKKEYAKREIPHSVIGKQTDNGSTSIHYSAVNKTWKVGHWGDKILTVDDLKRVYKDITISPNDELWINGEKVDKLKHPELFAKN